MEILVKNGSTMKRRSKLTVAATVTLAVLAVASAGIFRPTVSARRFADPCAGKSSASACEGRCGFRSAGIGAEGMMFKPTAESAAKSRESSGTKNSWRAEASARSPHAEQRVEVRRAARTGNGRRTAVVAVRRKRAAEIGAVRGA